ncbi:MAG: MaoC family dehydratase N-terminal domain-containing protein [Propionibacteriaceae bacterium]|nr:MaoC family dehydratase N-terminal domain-containing protein [Propionibacteriaceae bacterium]
MNDEVRLGELRVGDRLYSGEEVEVTAEEIMAFARDYDPQPGHLSEETAQGTPFMSLAASGWHTAALTMRLLVGLGIAGSIGISVSLTWPTPTRPGDRLHIDGHVTSKRLSESRPDREILILEYETINQSGEIRQRTQAVVMTQG